MALVLVAQLWDGCLASMIFKREFSLLQVTMSLWNINSIYSVDCLLGPPLRPIITNFIQELVTNSSDLTYYLYWSAPFTWPQFPITSYNVTVINELTNNSTTTIMPINDSVSQNLSIDGITYGESCYRITFFVSAMNQLGVGEHSMMQSGHHISKFFFNYNSIVNIMFTYAVPSEIGDIETTVTFLSNGTPHLWMSFLVITLS